MAIILVVANPRSILQRKRGMAGLSGGHSLVWYAHEFEGLDNQGKIVKIKALPAKTRSKILKKLMFVAEPFYIRWIIKKYDVDLAHVHWAHRLFLFLGFPSRIPMVLTVMGSDILPERAYSGWKNRFMIRSMVSRADVITSKSEFMDGALKKINPGSSKKIRRVTWGIDLEIFRDGLDTETLRKRHAIKNGQTVFFDMRNAKPLYQKELILRAFAKIAGETDGILLVSERVGKREYLDFLHSLSSELGVKERIRFLGTISQEEMPGYYNLAHIGISIPWSDGLPQSLFEMMACGTYPILGDLAQYRSIIKDGENGTVVPIGDAEETVQCLAGAMADAAKKNGILEKTAVANREQITGIANDSEQIEAVNRLYHELLVSWQ